MWWHARLQEIQATRKKKASARFGRHIDTQVVIFDLTGLPMVPDKAGVKLFLGTTKIDEVRMALHLTFVVPMLIVNCAALLPRNP